MARLWYYAKVVDNQDPLNLGRVRAQVLTDDTEAIRQSVEDFNVVTDAWSEKDPFVFNSLLPIYIWSVPKVDELLQIYYHDTDDAQFLNAYYIQGPFSRIQNIVLENYAQSERYGDIRGIRLNGSKFIRNTDGSFKNPDPNGVFPDPGDVAVMGRGSTDLVLKENELLLRAGKYKGELVGDKDPVGNKNRAFLQLSKFDTSKIKEAQKTFFEIKESNPQVKYLIEYIINNPENSLPNPIYNGVCRLYKLVPSERTLAKALKVDSNIEDLKVLVAQEKFTNLEGTQQVIDFINLFIQTCNSKRKTASGVELFGVLEQRFPIYFRPAPFFYTQMSAGDFQTQRTLSTIYQKIKLNQNNSVGGYGLIYEQSKVGVPIKLIKNVVEGFKTTGLPSTFAALGGNKIYLLSQTSQIPGKKKINFDNSLYGIDETKFVTEIDPNTSSLVRGEELLEFMNQIVRFLISHTHAYPGEPPCVVTEDGSTVSAVLTANNEAPSKVLNQNIRLN